MIIQVRGLLAHRKLFADPTVDPLGHITGAGVWGEQYVLDHPRWVCVDAAELRPKAYELGARPKYYEWEAMEGHRVSIEGYLSHSAGGAPVIDLLDNSLYYVYLLGFRPSWPLEGAPVPVRVVGTVLLRYDSPRPGLDARGGVLVAARYEPRFFLTNVEVIKLGPDKEATTRDTH